MEADESVPLAFERREPEQVPEEMRWAERQAQDAPPMDITGMISELEASRGAAR